MPKLTSGELLPDLSVDPERPVSAVITESFALALAASEAPGINTLIASPQGRKTSMIWAEALGANVLDVEGRRFIDMTAGFGVAAAGHRHPSIVAAVCDQAEQLMHGLADVYAHPRRIELAQRLCSLVSDAEALDEPRVYFAVSGADAVEVALKTAQLATGRSDLVAFDPGYHGVTLGALEATSRQHFRSPFEARFSRSLTRLPFGCEIDTVVSAIADGTKAAIIVEPIVGREGVLLPPPGWLAELAQHAKRYGTLLIADEIYTGFGRTGGLFAHLPDGAAVDLICCGKALGGGLPIGAVLGNADTLSAWDRGGEAIHTGTFVAHPLACAAGLAFLDLYQELDLAARASAIGAEIENQLRDLAGSSPAVTAIRGRGLLWGIELRSAKEAGELSQRLLAHGVIALSGGETGRVVQLCPPLTIARPQLDFTLDALAQCLSCLSSKAESAT